MVLREEPTIDAVKIPWAPILAVIATVSVFAIAQGLSYPLFTFIMKEQGMSPAMIGLSAAMTPLGLILSAPFVPYLARRFGQAPLVVFCALSAAALFLAVGLLKNEFAWFVLRFLIGVVIDPLYVLSEVWMLSLAPPSKRGRLMGIYTAIIGAGFAAGPLSLMLVGSQGWPPFAIGITAFLICALLLSIVARRLPSMNDGKEHVSVMRFFRFAPALLLAVAVAAAFEQSALALLPIYGGDYGIGERLMSAMLAAMIAGNIALQIPLGLLAERFTARAVMIFCALASVFAVLLLPLIMQSLAVWPVLFVLGAVSYGIYTMSLIELGNRFSGSMLVTGNAAFALMWGLGGIAGPPGSGGAMQIFGNHSLPFFLAAMCVVLVLFTVYRELQRR
ncbi:MFS transporter [Mesorhizobium sp. SB112]|uniref:MFS transporter n=1 Tax=Mesorhizobium sp. SB112 TaxID=3151853 RepID=UPI0032662447